MRLPRSPGGLTESATLHERRGVSQVANFPDVNWRIVINAREKSLVATMAERKNGHPLTVAADTQSKSGSQVLTTAFIVLFCIVGLALWGLPFFYDFMVQQFGWSRAQVTSGNAISKLIVGPIFGFIAGWIVDRFGPRRLMLSGILMASIALVGLGSISSLPLFYLFYFFNALGYVCGGPLPVQVLLSRWFDKS